MIFIGFYIIINMILNIIIISIQNIFQDNSIFYFYEITIFE